MLNWECNLKPKKERECKIVLDDVPEDEAIVSSLWVSPNEGAHIDALMSYDPETEELHTDEVYTFAEALCKRAEEGDFKIRPLNPSEIHSEVEIGKRKIFDGLIERTHGTSINLTKPKI